MDTYDAWFDKAELYNDNFKRAEAIDYCYKLLEVKPHDLSLLEYLGRRLCFASRYDEALDIYDIALDIDKNNKKIIDDKWYVYYDSDRLNDALNFLKNLENIDDISYSNYASTGCKFEENKEYETALWCYKKGFETEEYGDKFFDTASVDGIKRVLIKLSIDDYSLLEDFYLDWISKIEYKFDTEHCPKCGGRFTPIIYGYVVGDGLFEEEEKDNVILGGCTVYEDSPTHYCKNCDEGFQFRSNGLKINYESETRQYHYVERIIYGITQYINNNQDEGSINIGELENEMRRIYGLNDIEFAAIIDKLIDVGYLYRSAEDHISLSEDNFYSLP